MTHKILTVDDSRTIRMIIKNAFKGYDCDLFEAENGREGLALAAKEKPDLIILDITMPVMTGIEMLRLMISDEALKNIAVIMLTAESGRDHIMKIIKMGVKDYMVKPFKGEQLIERVKLLLNLIPRLEGQDSAKTESGPGLFDVKDNAVVLRLPDKIKHGIIAEIISAVQKKITQMTAAAVRNLVIDVSSVENLTMTAIQLIITIIDQCVKTKLNIRLVATQSQIDAMKGFKETSAMPTFATIDEAMASY